MGREEVIVVKELYKSFGDKHILRGIDLVLHKGENLSIVGKSGTGKSVLTKCIVRLIEPDAGEINVLGTDVLACNNIELNEIRKKVGYLFQGGALYDSMSVRENLLFPIRRTRFIVWDPGIRKVLPGIRSMGIYFRPNMVLQANSVYVEWILLT